MNPNGARTLIRTVNGEIIDVDGQPESVVRIMGEDGILIICQRSNITVPMNSINLIQARETCGDLKFTTFEFMEKEIFMSSAVAKILFLLHGQYRMGTSKILIPVPQYKDSVLRSYGAYVATLFGGPRDVNVTFHLSIETATKQLKEITVNGGDILLCTENIQRTIPQTHSGTAFVSETYYYPPHLTNVRLDANLAIDYMTQGGGELQRDASGNIIWSREGFSLRA
ncbi:hypothetical protein DFP73DRAFT_546432 [Morchella snyderi]|nr:hypothetical protein DFP73DRAFT_546432 [Morchella snyderi]